MAAAGRPREAGATSAGRSVACNERCELRVASCEKAVLATCNSQLATSSEPYDVVAAVDVHHLAGDGRRHRRAEEERGVADLFELDVAAHRRLFGVVLEHAGEPLDAARGEGVHRAGGDGVDAHVRRAEVRGEI